MQAAAAAAASAMDLVYEEIKYAEWWRNGCWWWM